VLVLLSSLKIICKSYNTFDSVKWTLITFALVIVKSLNFTHTKSLIWNLEGKKFKVIWERKSAARYNGILNIYAFEPCNLLIRQSREEALKRPGDLRTARPKMIRTQFSKNIAND